MPSFGIVAALEREVRPLVRDWTTSDQVHEGRHFRFFVRDGTVVVCGGIGSEAARRATEALIALFHPGAVQSVGYAGALVTTLKAGDVLRPGRVIDARDGSSVSTGQGEAVLVTAPAVADPPQKRRLATSYGAAAVDMEAAAVARGAEARGVSFGALKAISDESDAVLPPANRFIAADGQFQSARFAVYAAVRPWVWPSVLRLAANSRKATRALCEALAREHQQRHAEVMQGV